MTLLPRLAVGSLANDDSHTFFLWGLLAALRRQGVQTRLFHTSARQYGARQARAATGADARHFDAWVMGLSPGREIFAHGCEGFELAVLEGSLSGEAGGALAAAANLLAAPQLAVLDVSRLCRCHVPSQPTGLAGIFLDRLTGPEQFIYWRTTLEALWGIPVLGGLEELAPLRGAQPMGEKGMGEWCEAISRRLHVRWPDGIFRPRPLAGLRTRECHAEDTAIFSPRHDLCGLTVAVAFDKAIAGYYAETLELLELRGASLRDFSPLHAAELPADTDLVYLGGGPVEEFAPRLAGNHCLKQALRQHAARGGTILGEGGGAAFLGRQLEDARGRLWPMAGLLPFVARRAPSGTLPEPVEFHLAQGSWLGSSDRPVRGYRGSDWRFEPCGPVASLARGPADSRDLIGTSRVVASNVPIHFAAHAHLLRRFRAAVPAGEPLGV